MKKILFAFSALMMLVAVSACNKDNNKEWTELKNSVLDANGKIVFDETSISGLYEIGVDSKADATALATVYAGSGFDGGNYTRTLSGNKGTVKVTKGTDGVFYSVRFGVEGIPAFTLDIKDANGENNEAAGHDGTYHKCDVCSRKWRGSSTTCPWTPVHGK